MIEFLYTSTYSTIDVGPSFSLFVHIKIHSLALKYGIRALTILAATKFSSALCQVSDLEVYFQSIREVYSQSLPTITAKEEAQNGQQPTPSAGSQITLDYSHSYALRAEVVDAALVELGNILSSPPVLTRFHQICATVPQFHADFLVAMLESKLKIENALESVIGNGEAEPLCDSCGPRDEGYEILIKCEGCGKNYSHTFQ
jgi:hypothetical protein